MRLLFAAAARSTNTRSLVESLVALGHEAHVATLHPGSIPGAVVHELGRSERGASRLAFARAIPGLRALHRALRPDVTIGYYASSYGLLTAFVHGPRVVVTAGGDILGDAQDSTLRRAAIPWIAGFALRRADLVLCWASHLQRAVEEMGVPSSRILTLPRGIDVATFRPAETPAPRAGRIVSTRAIAPFYRPELLVSAFLALRRRGIDARLHMVGDGPSTDTVARMAAAGGDRELALPGRLPPDRLADYLRACDVYASFPPSEGVSASLLEAMASGLVPVVTDLPSYRDWIDDGVNGILVPEPLTADSVADALARAVSDEALALRARTENPRRVRERADRARNARRFEAAFLEVVSRCVG